MKDRTGKTAGSKLRVALIGHEDIAGALRAALYFGLSERTLANWRVLGKGPKHLKRTGKGSIW